MYIAIMIIFYAVPCADRDVRLVEPSVGYRSGRIEVCVNNSWGTICSGSWNSIDASVACAQSGYSRYGTKNLVCM